MPTPRLIMLDSAAALNDPSQTDYTEQALTPMLNFALQTLQEEFQLNNVPVTDNVSSPALTMAVGANGQTGDRIALSGTNPTLPADLIEVRRVWESPSGLNQYVPMTRNDFLPHNLESGTLTPNFNLWAWNGQEIKLIPANANIDLKLDYQRSLFPRIDANNLEFNLPIINSGLYLTFETAAFAAYFIGENENRSIALDGKAKEALLRTLGITSKTRQNISTRRRPYRASYKMRGNVRF